MKKLSLNHLFNSGWIAPVIFFFFLPWLPIVSVFSLGLFVFYFFYCKSYQTVVASIKKSISSQWMIIYYLLFVIGMIYTQNRSYGLFDLQVKLSFLVMPFLFSGFALTRPFLQTLARAFIAGCVFGLGCFLVLSYFDFQQTHDVQSFFYMGLSHRMHPTYLSFYFNFAMILLLEDAFHKRPRNAVFHGLIFLFLLTGILLLFSRTSIAVTYFTLAIFPIICFGRRMKEKNIISFYMLSGLISVCLLIFSLDFNHRFEQVEKTLENKIHSTSNPLLPEPEQENSTNTRLKLWSYSFELFTRHPFFGVGTGDVKDELDNIYKEKKYEYAASGHYNPHNQYLHTAVTIGGLGLLVLLILLLLPFYSGWKVRNPLFLMFSLIIILNCLTESVLERQSGILFFAAFAVLLGSGKCKE